MKKVILGIMLVFSFSIFIACAGGDSEKPASAQTEAATVNEIDVGAFKKLKEEKPGTIVDVRTPSEVASGIVEGAVVIDIYGDDFKGEISKLDKTKPIYVYCKSGGRSSNASKQLLDLGYTQVYNLMGGMTSWKAKGYPTVAVK